MSSKRVSKSLSKPKGVTTVESKAYLNIHQIVSDVNEKVAECLLSLHDSSSRRRPSDDDISKLLLLINEQFDVYNKSVDCAHRAIQSLKEISKKDSEHILSKAKALQLTVKEHRIAYNALIATLKKWNIVVEPLKEPLQQLVSSTNDTAPSLLVSTTAHVRFGAEDDSFSDDDPADPIGNHSILNLGIQGAHSSPKRLGRVTLEGPLPSPLPLMPHSPLMPSFCTPHDSPSFASNELSTPPRTLSLRGTPSTTPASRSHALLSTTTLLFGILTPNPFDKSKDVCLPVPLPLPPSKAFVRLACGGTQESGGFCIAITTDGETYSFGCGNEGQLGIGSLGQSVNGEDPSTPRLTPRQRHLECDEAFLTTPRTIRNLPRPAVVSCGNAHSAALTADGRLYLWGRNYDGEVGVGSSRKIVPSPAPIFALGDEGGRGTLTWRSVSCGTSSHITAAVAADGSCYIWGAASAIMKLPDAAHAIFLPSPMVLPLRARLVACAEKFLAVLTTDDRIIQVGEGCSSTAILSGKGIVSLSAGSDHVLALTATGDVFSWGDNSYGQLGLGHCYNVSSPEKLSLPSSFVASSIAVGAFHSSVVSYDGKALLFGDNRFGQLGRETDQARNQSSPLPPSFLRSLFVRRVGCGPSFTIVVVISDVSSMSPKDFTTAFDTPVLAVPETPPPVRLFMHPETGNNSQNDGRSSFKMNAVGLHPVTTSTVADNHRDNSSKIVEPTVKRRLLVDSDDNKDHPHSLEYLERRNLELEAALRSLLDGGEKSTESPSIASDVVAKGKTSQQYQNIRASSNASESVPNLARKASMSATRPTPMGSTDERRPRVAGGICCQRQCAGCVLL